MIPRKPGYYWMRVRPDADWQLVDLSEKRVWWFRADCISREEFEQMYGNAEWSKPIERPKK